MKEYGICANLQIFVCICEYRCKNIDQRLRFLFFTFFLLINTQCMCKFMCLVYRYIESNGLHSNQYKKKLYA